MKKVLAWVVPLLLAAALAAYLFRPVGGWVDPAPEGISAIDDTLRFSVLGKVTEMNLDQEDRFVLEDGDLELRGGMDIQWNSVPDSTQRWLERNGYAFDRVMLDSAVTSRWHGYGATESESGHPLVGGYRYYVKESSTPAAE